MKSVKETLESVSKRDRDLLFYSFENGLTQIINTDDGNWIGVNVDGEPGLVIVESAGRWSVGRFLG